MSSWVMPCASRTAGGVLMSSAISLIRLTTSIIMCCSTTSASHRRSCSLLIGTTENQHALQPRLQRESRQALTSRQQSNIPLPDGARWSRPVDVGEAPFEQPRPAHPIPRHLSSSLYASIPNPTAIPAKANHRASGFSQRLPKLVMCVFDRGDARYFHFWILGSDDDDDSCIAKTPNAVTLTRSHHVVVVGRLGIGTDLSGNY